MTRKELISFTKDEKTKEAIKKALKMAEKSVQAYQESRKLDYETLNMPITI